MASRFTLLGCLGLFTLVPSGCHTYIPVQRPSPGTTVRAAVPVTSVVANPNRPLEVVSVEGSVLDTPGDSVILAVRNRRELGQFRVVLDVDTIRLARGDLVALEEQTLSRSRTVAFTAMVTAGAAGLALAAYRAGGGQGGDGGPGNGQVPAAIRVPPVILRAALGLIGYR